MFLFEADFAFEFTRRENPFTMREKASNVLSPSLYSDRIRADVKSDVKSDIIFNRKVMESSFVIDIKWLFLQNM